MKIRKYNEEIDYDKIILLFESEKDWSCFLGDKAIVAHKKSLKNTIAYVAYEDGELVGYLRSIEDLEEYIYVCELLVNKKYRGRSTGRSLLDRLCADFPDHVIYVMSDVDHYYKKLGYEIEGSIFKVSKL